MRFACPQSGISIVVLFLGLVFGAREFPELMSLADDVSNDGDVVEVVCVKEAHRQILLTGAPADASAALIALALESRAASGIHFPGAHRSAGRSLLSLLSLQRK